MRYDRSLIRADQVDALREWEYYAVFAPNFAIGLTLADLGLLSFGILTLEDYETDAIHSALFIAAAEALDFPPTPFENTLFEAQTGSIEYRFEKGTRTITVISGEEGSTTLSLGPPYTLTRWKVHGEIAGSVELANGSRLEVHGIRGAAEYVEIIW